MLAGKCDDRVEEHNAIVQKLSQFLDVKSVAYWRSRLDQIMSISGYATKFARVKEAS